MSRLPLRRNRQGPKSRKRSKPVSANISFRPEIYSAWYFSPQELCRLGRLLGLISAVGLAVSKSAKTDIKSLQFEELKEKARELGEPPYRAQQIVDWLYQKRVQAFDEMTDLPHEFR